MLFSLSALFVGPLIELRSERFVSYLFQLNIIIIISSFAVGHQCELCIFICSTCPCPTVEGLCQKFMLRHICHTFLESA